MKFKKEEGIS